jgi:predicted transcriptional regulator
MSDRWFSQEHRQARLAALHEAVMIGAAEADRGELLDGESAMAALRDKLERLRPKPPRK